MTAEHALIIGWQVPYEDVLPYKDFALRLPQHAIHDLPRILEELLTKQPQRVSICSPELPSEG